MTLDTKRRIAVMKIPLLMLVSTATTALLGFPKEMKLNIGNIAFLLAGILSLKTFVPTLRRQGIAMRVAVVVSTQALIYYAAAAYIWTHGDTVAGLTAVVSGNALVVVCFIISILKEDSMVDKEEQKKIDERVRKYLEEEPEEEEEEKPKKIFIPKLRRRK